MNQEQFRLWFLRRLRELNMTQTDFAIAHRMSVAMVSRAVCGRIQPSHRMLKALGLRRVVTYELEVK